MVVSELGRDPQVVGEFYILTHFLNLKMRVRRAEDHLENNHE